MIYNISCECGYPLTKYDHASSIYNGDTVGCDSCQKDIPEYQPAWHCDTGKSTNHPYGYDICQDCTTLNIANNYQIVKDYQQLESSIFGIENGMICWVYMINPEKNHQ